MEDLLKVIYRTSVEVLSYLVDLMNKRPLGVNPFLQICTIFPICRKQIEGFHILKIFRGPLSEEALLKDFYLQNTYKFILLVEQSMRQIEGPANIEDMFNDFRKIRFILKSHASMEDHLKVIYKKKIGESYFFYSS